MPVGGFFSAVIPLVEANWLAKLLTVTSYIPQRHETFSILFSSLLFILNK